VADSSVLVSMLAMFLVKRHKVLNKGGQGMDKGIDLCSQSKIITAPSLAGFAFSAR
jgi:hypothetical protein